MDTITSIQDKFIADNLALTAKPFTSTRAMQRANIARRARIALKNLQIPQDLIDVSISDAWDMYHLRCLCAEECPVPTNTKGYGVVNRKKKVGNIATIDGHQLREYRYNYRVR